MNIQSRNALRYVTHIATKLDVCCRVLQRVAARCSVLRCVCADMSQSSQQHHIYVAVCCTVLHCVTLCVC